MFFCVGLWMKGYFLCRWADLEAQINQYYQVVLGKSFITPILLSHIQPL